MSNLFDLSIILIAPVPNMFSPSWWQEGMKVCLPTEEQWLSAAQWYEKTRDYPWGNRGPDDKRANYDYHQGQSTKIDEYPLGATPEGCMDLAGNVWEWGLEQWSPESSKYRVIRGGSWRDPSSALATSARHQALQWDNHIGFRCCVVVSNGE